MDNELDKRFIKSLIDIDSEDDLRSIDFLYGYIDQIKEDLDIVRIQNIVDLINREEISIRLGISLLFFIENPTHYWGFY